eukprot:m.17965 g.17965  ORF g.17965 m.17965 type:complete len:454 (-) comp3631_c0_seq1:160-1521(-)
MQHRRGTASASSKARLMTAAAVWRRLMSSMRASIPSSSASSSWPSFASTKSISRHPAPSGATTASASSSSAPLRLAASRNFPPRASRRMSFARRLRQPAWPTSRSSVMRICRPSRPGRRRTTSSTSIASGRVRAVTSSRSHIVPCAEISGSCARALVPERLDENSDDARYANLLENPERFTGYVGNSPARIWAAIYNENCFKPDPSIPFLTSEIVGNMCREKRVFYRVVSGLHACINVHVAADFPTQPAGFPPPPIVWGPNVTMFERMFDPARTFGEGPSRLKNMYFTYLLLLRAIVKAAPLWEPTKFQTGIAEDDQATAKLVRELIAAAESCPHTFDETLMFNEDAETAMQLKEEFRSHFRNVSRIMDCVGCEKCRMWGKLQIQGLGAAMKILFSPTPSSGAGAANAISVPLRRNEVVSLFNTFGRFSQGLAEVNVFRSLIRERDSRVKDEL